jgi:hypothetical protein
MSDIPSGAIFGRRVGHQPKSEAEHFIRCPAYGEGSEKNPIHVSHRCWDRDGQSWITSLGPIDLLGAWLLTRQLVDIGKAKL